MWLVQQWALTIHRPENKNIPSETVLDKHAILTYCLYEIKITIYSNSI